ncbi:hypothetical protein BZA77DRAFT_322971, partial [Pyronema omphalodes]
MKVKRRRGLCYTVVIDNVFFFPSFFLPFFLFPPLSFPVFLLECIWRYFFCFLFSFFFCS